MGGSATSDNISPLNLMNIRRAAYGTKELSDLSGSGDCDNNSTCSIANEGANIEEIVKKVLNELLS